MPIVVHISLENVFCFFIAHLYWPHASWYNCESALQPVVFLLGCPVLENKFDCHERSFAYLFLCFMCSKKNKSTFAMGVQELRNCERRLALYCVSHHEKCMSSEIALFVNRVLSILTNFSLSSLFGNKSAIIFLCLGTEDHSSTAFE